jgi:hypothetical protein
MEIGRDPGRHDLFRDCHDGILHFPVAFIHREFFIVLRPRAHRSTPSLWQTSAETKQETTIIRPEVCYIGAKEKVFHQGTQVTQPGCR